MRTTLISTSILLLTLFGAALAQTQQPEPGSIVLTTTGLAIAGYITWRRRK